MRELYVCCVTISFPQVFTMELTELTINFYKVTWNFVYEGTNSFIHTTLK